MLSMEMEEKKSVFMLVKRCYNTWEKRLQPCHTDLDTLDA